MSFATSLTSMFRRNIRPRQRLPRWQCEISLFHYIITEREKRTGGEREWKNER